MSDNAYTNQVLNRIAKVSETRRKNFIKAAKYIRDSKIKYCFDCKANEVELNLIELEALLNIHAGTISYSMDITSLIEHSWTDLRNMILGYNRKIILNDVERSENYAADEYLKIANLYLPPKVRMLVMQQINEAQNNQIEVKEMRQTIISMTT